MGTVPILHSNDKTFNKSMDCTNRKVNTPLELLHDKLPTLVINP